MAVVTMVATSFMWPFMAAMTVVVMMMTVMAMVTLPDDLIIFAVDKTINNIRNHFFDVAIFSNIVIAAAAYVLFVVVMVMVVMLLIVIFMVRMVLVGMVLAFVVTSALSV